MTQLSLPSGDWLTELLYDDGLRYYQQEAVDAIEQAWERVRSVLCVMATGLGKTQTFGKITKDADGHVLVLAHREELVDQARRRLEQMTGEPVEIEQAALRSGHARIVVGSVDTVKQKHRLERMGVDRFQYVIADESHHYVDNSYVRPLEFFHKAKVLGVTATADRGDKKALGRTFDEVAYDMDIAHGIEAGYLTPIKGRRIRVEEVNLTGVKKQAGDLHQGQLDSVMVKAVEGIVRETLRLEPDRSGIAFFPGVASAELASIRFNALRPGSACFISGETPREERKDIIAGFRAGKYKYLCNCQVAIEGFDAPHVDMIIHGRPTSSRAMYTQMSGRGTRVLPNTVDHIDGREGAVMRRAAIAASAKSECVLLDFVGNSGKHDLMSPEDLLGGDYSDVEIKLAKKKAETEGGGDPVEYLKEARSAVERAAQAIADAKVRAREEEFNPFGVFNMQGVDKYTISHGFKPCTDNQFHALVRMGLSEKEADNTSAVLAKKMLGAAAKRREVGLASYKQMRVLKKYGIDKANVSFKNARKALDFLAQNNWRPVDEGLLREIAYGDAATRDQASGGGSEDR